MSIRAEVRAANFEISDLLELLWKKERGQDDTQSRQGHDSQRHLSLLHPSYRLARKVVDRDRSPSATASSASSTLPHHASTQAIASPPSQRQ